MWEESHLPKEQRQSIKLKHVMLSRLKGIINISTAVIDKCDIHTHSHKARYEKLRESALNFRRHALPIKLKSSLSAQNIVQSKPSQWRYDGCKHARAATRKTTWPDTSFTIAAAGAYGLMLCLSCQSSSAYSVSRSRTASWLFVLLVSCHTSALPCAWPSASYP